MCDQLRVMLRGLCEVTYVEGVFRVSFAMGFLDYSCVNIVGSVFLWGFEVDFGWRWEGAFSFVVVCDWVGFGDNLWYFLGGSFVCDIWSVWIFE